jgi:hypothetical protein
VMEHPRGPRTYKSRRERPCDLCRTRKVACRIDAAPPCALCRTQGVTCTFIQRPGKRKRPTPQENVVHAAGRGIYTGPSTRVHPNQRQGFKANDVKIDINTKRDKRLMLLDRIQVKNRLKRLHCRPPIRCHLRFQNRVREAWYQGLHLLLRLWRRSLPRVSPTRRTNLV